MPNTPKMPRRAVFFDQLLKKINALPGVESSGVVNPAPIEGWRGAMLVYIAVYDVKTLDELLAGFGRAAAFYHAAGDAVFRVRSGPDRAGNLRRGFLLGEPASAGDRNSHGARRTARRGAGADRGAGVGAGSHRGNGRIGGRVRGAADGPVDAGSCV